MARLLSQASALRSLLAACASFQRVAVVNAEPHNSEAAELGTLAGERQMPLPVSLDEVAGQLEILGDETAIFVNRKTGDIEMVFLPDLSIVEEGREEEEELEWGEESIPVLRSIAESEDWFCLPDKFEIHEWEVMKQFAESRPPHLAAELRNAIHGSGAFRCSRISSIVGASKKTGLHSSSKLSSEKLRKR